jgi:hypothetical protein
MDNNNILDSNCKDLYKKLYIDNKLKALENKLLTYIDIYNITYTKIYEDSNDDCDDDDPNTNNPIITYTTIKLERIGNIEKLYTNFTNNKKNLNKQLSYSVHKINILVILDTLHYIMISKKRAFDFHLYSYELFNVIGIVKSIDTDVHNNNIYVIQQKNQNLNYNFTGSCIMLIFIRDKMFIHYY